MAIERIDPDRKYVIISSSEAPLIDFNQVFEDDISTLRRSLDNLQTVVKYNGTQPSSISSLTSKSQEYIHTEISSIMTGSNWQPEEEEELQ